MSEVEEIVEVKNVSQVERPRPAAYSNERIDPVSPAVERATVLILGGGMAGVAAAHTLHLAGISDLILIEATGRIGGRVCEVDFGGIKVEKGANWIHGVEKNANPLQKIADKLNMKIHVTDDNDVAARDCNGKDVTSDVKWAWKLMRSATETAVEKQEDVEARPASQRAHKPRRLSSSEESATSSDISLASGMATSGIKWEARTPAQIVAEYYEADFEYALNARSISLRGLRTTEVEEQFGVDDGLVVDQRGYSEIIRHLARQVFLPHDRRLVLGEEVHKVFYDPGAESISMLSKILVPGGVYVTTRSGRKFFAPYAIITFSNGVLIGGDVEFAPSLPDWKDLAIRCTPCLPFEKLFVRFPASAPRFWDDTQYILFADSAPVPAAAATATPKEKLRADVPDGSVQSIQTISGGAVGAEADEVVEEVVTRRRSHSVSSAPTRSGEGASPAVSQTPTTETPLEGFLKARNSSVAIRLAQRSSSKFSRGFYSVWMNLDREPLFQGSRALLCFLVAEVGAEAALKSDDELKNDVWQVMRVMYGPEVPRPVEVFLSRWSANRFTRGSFHSFARGCSSSVVKDISRNVGRLYFAGDGTDPDYTGYLNGAYRSGIVQAKAILEKLQVKQ